MKCKAKRTPDKFKPVEIKLTFESEAEVKQFYSIFSHVDILSGAPNISGICIRDSIKSVCGEINIKDPFNTLANSIRKWNRS